MTNIIQFPNKEETKTPVFEKKAEWSKPYHPKPVYKMFWSEDGKIISNDVEYVIEEDK